MTSKPTQQFPAVVTPLPLAERDTERPAPDQQSALLAASRAASDWRREPLWAIDYATSKMILAMPYTAVQTDRCGYVFEVTCPQGIEIPRLPTSVDQAQFVRSVLVETVLRLRQDTVFCYAPGGTGGCPLAVDELWSREIVQAFIDGDAGRLRRG